MPNLAIVGAGVMGANHGRVAQAVRELTVTAICDPDLDRAAASARPHGARYTRDLDEAMADADAVVLATPSDTHAELGVRVLKAGRDLLVEKPIATSADDGQTLIDAAQANDRVLMIGHVERFNPAIAELANLVDRPVALEITRASPYPGRILADVVLDLMIHDIDLARAIIGGEIVEVTAMGRSVRSGDPDLACALLRFDNGVVANLTASRVSQNKVRRLTLTQRENTVVVDLVRQQVEVHRIEHSEYLSEGGARYRQSGVVEIPYLSQYGEPLVHELRHFAARISDRGQPLTTAQDALIALRVALGVADSVAGR